MLNMNNRYLIIALIIVVCVGFLVVLFTSHFNYQTSLSVINNTDQNNNSSQNNSSKNITNNSNNFTNHSAVQYRLEGSAAADRPYCSACGSNNVDMTGNQYTDANNVTWYQVHCNYCGKTWYTRGPY